MVFHIPVRSSKQEIENLTPGEEIGGSFDVENITAETLLFQAGYRTIANVILRPWAWMCSLRRQGAKDDRICMKGRMSMFAL